MWRKLVLKHQRKTPMSHSIEAGRELLLVPDNKENRDRWSGESQGASGVTAVTAAPAQIRTSSITADGSSISGQDSRRKMVLGRLIMVPRLQRQLPDTPFRNQSLRR